MQHTRLMNISQYPMDGDAGVTQTAYLEMCTEEGLVHTRHRGWYCEPETDLFKALSPFDVLRTGRTSGMRSAVVRHADGALSMVNSGYSAGVVHAQTAATSRESSDAALEEIRGLIPAREQPDEDILPVSFWYSTANGPVSKQRDLDSTHWATIRGNYPSERTREDVEGLMGMSEGGANGKMILWHGPAGTGKTTALRALGHAWRDWCDLHYVTDPEQFFGGPSHYMMNVLLDEQSKDRWRLLVLEDCGEMLAPDARREVGQGLSRFLNACDGLIGRGLPFLVLVTTNEPLERLHEAVRRPGRCISSTEFPAFSVDQAAKWVGEAVEQPVGHMTLAEMYALTGGYEGGRDPRGDRRIGFTS